MTITSAAWDRVKNVSGFNDGQGAGPPLVAPPSLPTTGVSAGVDTSSLHYYVQLTLYDGTTVTVDGNQLFALDGFSFKSDQTLNIGSQSSGAGAGTVTFDPLHLSLDQPGLNPQLFEMLAAGEAFKEVDVLGYQVGADSSQLAIDYSFGLVAAQTLGIDASGTTQIDLQYGSEEIQTFTQQPDGSVSPDTSAAWDRVKNVSGFNDGQGAGPPLVAPPSLPTTGVSAGVDTSSLHYYVQLTLYDGTTVTVDGNQLFALDGFSFKSDQTLNIGSQSSGAGAGTVTFDPLHLSLDQPGLNPQLFEMLAAGEAFKEVDVLGYQVGADSSQLAIDYSFGLVAAQTLGIDASGTTQIDLQYGSEEIQTFTQQPDGSVSPDTSAAWDRVKDVSGFNDGQGAGPPLVAPPSLPTTGVSAGVDTSSLHYYVQLTLYDGTTVTVDGNQLFALDGFSFKSDQTLNIGSQSSGAGAGTVTFDPLHLSLDQPGLNPQLFEMLAAGVAFKEVDVLGYQVGADSSQLAIDYSFGLVGAQTLGIDASGVSQIDLQYGSEEIQTFTQQPDGSPTPDTSAAWDGVKDVSGFNDGQGAGPPLVAPPSLPTTGVSAGVDTSSLHYYVQLTLYDGTTVTVDGNQLFALDGFSFKSDQTLNIGSQSSGAGAGTVTFDPLHLSLDQPGLNPQLFEMLAAGEAFKEVDVLGYQVGADSSQLAIDYSFGLVAAQTLGIDASGTTQIDLQYGSEEIQTFTQQPDGSVSPDTSAAWDRVKDVSGFNDGQGAGPPLVAPPSLPTTGVSAGVDTSSLHYYVQLTLYDGTTVTVDGNQLFALDGFSFKSDQTLNIGSQSSGAGAGTVTFDPLHLSLDQPGLNPQLFEMLAAGEAFKEVDVLGYQVGADSSQLAIDYSFGLVAAQTLGIDASGVSQIDLQYGSEEIQTFTQQPDGSPTPDTSAAWDGVKDVSGFNDGQGAGPPLVAPPSLPTTGVSAGVDTSSLHYYVQLTLYDGTTVTVDGNQLFALDGFSFKSDQTLNIGSQSSGAGAGTVTFDPLHLSLDQPGLNPQLFEMLAAGEAFKEVDVLGYQVGADSSQLAIDYSFGLVGAQTLGIDASGVSQIDLQYGSEEIQYFDNLPTIPATPVVTAVSSSVNASASETFSPAQLFSASDTEGLPILSYQVEDESDGANNGFWVLSGTVLPNGQITTLTAAQLSQLSFVAGSASTPVSDTLEVAASDAAGLGAFSTFTVTAAAHAPTSVPTVTAANELQAPNQALVGSSLFSGTAFGGNTITSYEVEDTTPDSGHWMFNGTVEPTNQIIDVTVAQLAQLTFDTGYGSDTLEVRANDGSQWGNFTTFTVTPPPNAAPPAGTSDTLVMLRNSDGAYEFYDIGNNGILLAGPLGQIDPALQVAGIGGFNGADTADLLMRDPTTGVLTLYDVSNNNITGNVSMGQVGPEWTVSGFGDFSGHAGETDMLMRNSNSGAFEVYDIANNAITSYAPMGPVGLEWSVAGFGDFSTRANETDLLMRNSNTGAFEVYDIVNNTITSYGPMGQVGPEWTIAGFGDFAGHANETDMLMRNSNTGAFEVYDISNNTITSYAPMGQVGLEWSIAGFGDFSGNANETDMLMRNSNTGAFALFDISNNIVTLATGMGQVGLEWSISGVAASPASAPPATQLSGPAVDPAAAVPSSATAQLTQAMASFAPGAGTPAASSPIDQAAMQSTTVSPLAASTEQIRQT